MTLDLIESDSLTSFKRDLLATGSKPTVGSSRNRIYGSVKRERAVESFLLFPPLRISAYLLLLSRFSFLLIRLNFFSIV